MHRLRHSYSLEVLPSITAILVVNRVVIHIVFDPLTTAPALCGSPLALGEMSASTYFAHSASAAFPVVQIDPPEQAVGVG